MTFDRKLFFSIGSLFIVFVVIILLFEYKLEKDNRQQSLNNLLQDYNEMIYSQIKDLEINRTTIDSIIQGITQKPLRVTIISASDGKILFESQKDKEAEVASSNHLNRPEIKSALTNGIGYSMRYSQSIQENYFYSAKRYGDWVFRSSGRYTILRLIASFAFRMVTASP